MLLPLLLLIVFGEVYEIELLDTLTKLIYCLLETNPIVDKRAKLSSV